MRYRNRLLTGDVSATWMQEKRAAVGKARVVVMKPPQPQQHATTTASSSRCHSRCLSYTCTNQPQGPNCSPCNPTIKTFARLHASPHTQRTRQSLLSSPLPMTAGTRLSSATAATNASCRKNMCRAHICHRQHRNHTPAHSGHTVPLCSHTHMRATTPTASPWQTLPASGTCSAAKCITRHIIRQHCCLSAS